MTTLDALITGPTAPAHAPRRGAFNLVLISAWNDSGGAFLHRLFDGQPEIFAYPFELQLGVDVAKDGLDGWFHRKYRWPRFPASLGRLSAAEVRALFVDDELKTYLRDRAGSKFAAFDLHFAEHDAATAFDVIFRERHSTPPAAIEAYVRSVFVGWRNRARSGREWIHLGHCPAVVIDADEIFADFPSTRIIHVVRDPVAGFADIRRRLPTMTPQHYAHRWALVNSLGCYYALKHPKRCFVVRYEDLLTDREGVLRDLSRALGIAFHPALLTPSWNGRPLAAIPPFGGVPEISSEHEDLCRREVAPQDREAIERESASALRLLEVTTGRRRDRVEARGVCR